MNAGGNKDELFPKVLLSFTFIFQEMHSPKAAVQYIAMVQIKLTQILHVLALFV